MILNTLLFTAVLYNLERICSALKYLTQIWKASVRGRMTDVSGSAVLRDEYWES